MNKTPMCFVNGKLAEFSIYKNRGLSFGDGVFETIAVKNSKIPFLDLHLERLISSCERLSISLNRERLLTEIRAFCAFVFEKRVSCGRLKLIVTRGYSEAGCYPLTNVESDIVFIFSDAEEPFNPRVSKVNVIRSSAALSCMPELAGIKHLSRLPYIVACKDVQKKFDEEIMFFDTQKHVIETMHHNIFFVSGAKVVTPLLSDCGVEGVMKRFVQEYICPQLQLSWESRQVSVDEISLFDEVFLTNAIKGVVPVKNIIGRELSNFTIANQCQKVLQNFLVS